MCAWHLTLENDAATQYFCHRSLGPHAVIVIVQEGHHVAVLNMDKQSGRVLAKHPHAHAMFHS
jgi:L-rhamnose isomerase